MIVQIAGTNGSGKSTVVRTVMAACSVVPLENEDHRLVGYWLAPRDAAKAALLIGPYISPTGGCDALSGLDEVYVLLRSGLAEGGNVLFEGAGHMMNQTRGPELRACLPEPLTVVLLTTPLGTCLASVNERRAERGAGVLKNLRNVENNYVRARNYAARMREAGARVLRASRDEAPGLVLDLLKNG